jgi:methylamine utilization protein MauJ
MIVIGIPGKNVYRNHLQIGQGHADSDSLVVFPERVVSFNVRLDESGKTVGEIVLRPNSERRLALAQMRVQAKSFVDAEKTAYNTVAGFLSYLSYSTDVGIEISGYEITEESTGTRKAVFGMLGKMKYFAVGRDIGPMVSDENYRRVFAAYREGMNAANVFYQALSFAKVIEGCGKIRNGKNAKAKKSGTELINPSLSIPDNVRELPIEDDLLRDCFKPFLGRKFSYVIDHFRPVVRNAISHLDPTKQVLDIDRFDDVQACERAIPS